MQPCVSIVYSAAPYHQLPGSLQLVDLVKGLEVPIVQKHTNMSKFRIYIHVCDSELYSNHLQCIKMCESLRADELPGRYGNATFPPG